MRLFWRVKRFVLVLLAVMFCAVFLFTARLTTLSRLSGITGDRTYFLDSASSQALRTKTLSLQDIGRVKGECVRVDFSAKEGSMYASKEKKQSLAQEITEKYSAKILRIEELAGVTSYYAYAPSWSGGILVEGELINLHIAIRDDGYAVGTPLIFEGY